MIKLFYNLIFLLITSQAYTQTDLTGEFLDNSILNQPVNSDSVTKSRFKNTLSKVNITSTEKYLDHLIKFQSDQADSIKKTDPILKGQSERMIAMLYNFYYINQNGLLDLYCLTLKEESSGSNQVVYMSQPQYVSLKNKKTTLNVQLIRDLPYTKTRLFRLVE